MDAVADDADSGQLLVRPLLPPGGVLGWRASAISQLKGSHLDLCRAAPQRPHGRVLKAHDSDKEGVAMWVPLSQDAQAAIDLVLERRPVVGDRWLFPDPADQSKSWSRVYVSTLFRRCYRLASVPKEEQVGWHGFRRKWVDERKHLPRADVAAAGGWRDPQTLDICEQPDDATLLSVVSEPRKLRSSGGGTVVKTVAEDAG